MGSQPGPAASPEPKHEPSRALRGATEPVVVSGLAAHAAVVVFTVLSVQPPLLTAIAATLVFAGITLAYARQTGVIVGPLPWLFPASFLADAVVLVMVSAGGWLIGRAIGSGATFYCEPLVPWRIEITLLGGFGVAYVTGMARHRRHAWLAYPFVVLALVWIAPLYGFFSAPLFLVLSLNAACPDRPIIAVVLAAIGMRVGEQLGLSTAGWISSQRP